MAQSLSNQVLPRWLLVQAGGSLQHARSLLSMTGTLGSVSSSGSNSSSWSSSSCGPVLSQEAGRSICTTRGIYMGRVFLRENLQRHPPQSPIFNRENYQYLEKNGWSLAAAEQVLHNHQGRRPHNNNRGGSLVFKQLSANIQAAESLDQLQLLITRHAHQMNAVLLARAISQTPKVMLKPDGTPDYQAAALVLESIGRHLQPKAAELNPGSICYIMSAYVRCRSSPPADLLHELLQSLLLNDSEKLQQTTAMQLGQLLFSLTRMVQPQGQWPLMKAVLQHATTLLRQQLEQPVPQPPAQQQQQLEGDSSSSSKRKGKGKQQQEEKFDPAEHKAQKLQAMEQQQEFYAWRGYVQGTNATALTALLLDRSNTYSPEYLRLLYQWLEGTDKLAVLYPSAAVQLWTALRGQWAKFEARTAANSASAAAAAEADADEAAAEAAAAPGDVDADVAVSPGDADAGLALTSAKDSMEQNREKLKGFFGAETLKSLAAATTPLVSSMTEANLGQLFNALGRLRYVDGSLLAAAAQAYQALCKVQSPTHITKANAIWAATQLQQYDAVLMLPAVLAAVQSPDQLDGFLAARIMIATSQMPQEVQQQMQLLLRQELHRQSGARGPAPAAAAAAADPATSAVGQVPDWIASLADSLAGRVPELRPREIAYILLSYSQLPGVPVHERLFTAAAEHIEAHTDSFVQQDDMEMVAVAFEHLNFKAGVPALKALQHQQDKLASGRQA